MALVRELAAKICSSTASPSGLVSSGAWVSAWGAAGLSAFCSVVSPPEQPKRPRAAIRATDTAPSFQLLRIGVFLPDRLYVFANKAFWIYYPYSHIIASPIILISEYGSEPLALLHGKRPQGLTLVSPRERDTFARQKKGRPRSPPTEILPRPLPRLLYELASTA